MWPWEHLAFGYLLYSGLSRLAGYRPRGGPVLLLALATQLPDLIDKPLGWQFGFYATGYGAAHSLLVAGPVVVLLAALTLRVDRPFLGAGLSIGYASHLLGDAINPLRNGNPPRIDRLLWPVSSLPEYDREFSFVERFGHYVGEFVQQLAQPSHAGFLLLYVAVFVGVAAVWLLDGAPGVGVVVDAVKRRGRTALGK